MIVKINFNDELEDALQEHFDNGLSVQSYIKASIRFFMHMKKQEQEGKAIGFGNKNRFSSYNTKVSPKKYLDLYRGEQDAD